MADSSIGKEAEKKIKEWLDRPEDGYSFDRIPDQMTGFYQVSRNICDFTLFKYPYMYYIESKATWEDRFNFNMLTNTQHDGLLYKSRISGVFGVVIVLFASYKRAFIVDIRLIKALKDAGIKSLNIKKIDSQNWIESLSQKFGIDFKIAEIQTIPNNRKKLLDYSGEMPDYVDKFNYLVQP